MVLMLFVLTNAFLDMKELERGELVVAIPWLVAGRFERREDWVDGMLQKLWSRKVSCAPRGAYKPSGRRSRGQKEVIYTRGPPN